MNDTTASPDTVGEQTNHTDETQSHGSHGPGGSLAKLAVGAVGVVFGDIGTSPLYAFRETFASHNGLPGI